MDLIAIDIGREFVSLGKWDGRRAIALRRPVCFPEVGWDEWTGLLQPCDRHEVAFRCTHPEWSALCSREAIESLARAAGCHWLRYLKSTPGCDAGLAAARYLANRTRWTRVLSIEVCGGVIRLASQDRRGKIHEFVERRLPPCTSPAPALLIDLAKGLSGPTQAMRHAIPTPVESVDQQFGMICLGDGAEDWGHGAARGADIANVLVPTHAESWPVLGMMIAPIEQCFERELSGATLSESEIRHMFAELMDEAYESVTREGYDLDDAETRRTVVFNDGRDSRLVEIEMENLLEPTRRNREWTHELQVSIVDDSDAISVRFRQVVALRSSVTIFPPTPDWPIDVAPPLNFDPR